VAERLALQRHLLLFWGGLSLQQVGRAVGSTSGFDLALTACSLAAYLIVLVLVARDAGRARPFLAAHPVGATGN